MRVAVDVDLRVREGEDLLAERVLSEVHLRAAFQKRFRTGAQLKRTAYNEYLVLFAEARGLLPVDNAVYHASYGLRGLQDDLRKLATLVVNCDLHVSGKNTNKDEFVTAGGVSLQGVDMSRLQSRSVSGLFFCGEVLDIDGVTGGYNLQSAWTTGTIAGRSIAAAAAASHA